MAKWIKNNTQAAKTWINQEVAAGAYYQIQASEESTWANDSALLIDIANTDAIVAKDNTGNTNITNINDAINFLKDNLPKQVDLVAKTSGNIPKVAIYEPEGYSKAYVSHDFTDPCTWFGKSSQVTGETLSGSGVGPYTSANTNWIDLTHGKHTGEDDISSTYTPNIYDNGVLKTEGTDFTINYSAGTVTFNSTPAGPVTADYSYENGSTFSLIPSSNTILKIEHAELDFSVDITMSTVYFELWAYNPSDLPNKMLVERVVYKNEKDVLAIANSVTEISPWGSIVKATKRAEFDYGRTIDLKSSLGMELRLKIANETAFSKTDSSSFATITFYTAEENE